MTQTAEDVFRDFVTDGVPASGAHHPRKAEIREWGASLEANIAGFQAGGGIVFQTKAAMTLGYAVNQMAWVIADSTSANNGIYQKQGGSGAGSWTRVADLPYSFIVASDVGEGSPDSIQATSSLPISGSALVLLNVFQANTGSPVTVAFNGNEPLVIKSSSGNDIAPGGLQPNMLVMGRVYGSDFRIVTDQESSAIIAQAEGWAQQAGDEAGRAEDALAAVTGLATTMLDPQFPTRTAAMAFSPAIAPEYIRTSGYAVVGDNGGALYRKVASEPSHAGKFSITLSGGSGAVWYELAKGQPIYAEMFGAVAHQTDAAALAGGASDSTIAILNAIAFLRSNGDSLSDGLTNKIITAYTSGVLNFGEGIFNVVAGAIRITQDINLVWQGRGSRGKTNFARAATTILITGSSSYNWASFGIEAYGNGSRGFRQLDMDICYASSGFQGNVLSLKGSPGSYPERCMIGTFGIRGGTRLQTARSCISLAWDEFFNPNECVFDGAQYFIKIEDENRLASFVGSVSGTTLTVTEVTFGELGTDIHIYDAGVRLATITALGTGTGGTGTYTLSAAATKTSRQLEADNSWGGSNSNINNSVFYDCGLKSIEFRGARRRTRQSVTNTIVNPITVNASIGMDFRGVDGLSINNCDFVGSVGNAPAVAWLWMQNCTGSITSNVFGQGSLGAQFTSSIADVTGNALNGFGGFLVDGGIVTGKSNEFLLTSGAGWVIPQSSNAFIDIGPDWFNSNVSASYNLQGAAGANLAKGRILRSISHDFSASGAINGATGVTITSI